MKSTCQGGSVGWPTAVCIALSNTRFVLLQQPLFEPSFEELGEVSLHDLMQHL